MAIPFPSSETGQKDVGESWWHSVQLIWVDLADFREYFSGGREVLYDTKVYELFLIIECVIHIDLDFLIRGHSFSVVFHIGEKNFSCADERTASILLEGV